MRPHRSRSRFISAALATLWLYLAVAFAQLALPTGAFACSCVPPRPLAEYGRDQDHVVIAGTVGQIDAQGRGPFKVNRVYHGVGVPGLMPIQGGDEAMCGVRLVGGERVIFVGSIFEGVLHPSGCTPFASLADPAGQRLAAEADAVFGGFGIPPPAASPLPVATPPGALDAALLVSVGGLAIGVLLVFGLVALVARRRRFTA